MAQTLRDHSDKAEAFLGRDRRKQFALKNDASCLHYIYQYGVLVLPLFGDILTWPGNRIAPLDL